MDTVPLTEVVVNKPSRRRTSSKTPPCLCTHAPGVRDPLLFNARAGEAIIGARVTATPVIVTLLVASTSASAATPTASPLNGQNGVLDSPTSFEERPARAPRGMGGPDEDWRITCLHFPGYTIKSLESPGNKGAVVVSAQPTGPAAPRCGAQDDPGEKVIANGFYLVGARGGFVVTESTDSYDFSIYDAFTGRRLYADTASWIYQADFSVRDDVLTLAYTRAVVAKCSLLTGGAQCWAQVARDAKLPAEIARMPSPVAACEKSYQALAGTKDYRSDPSVVTYLATITVERSGRSAVLSRSRLSCEPQP
jgi:hypothetical protein